MSPSDHNLTIIHFFLELNNLSLFHINFLVIQNFIPLVLHDFRKKKIQFFLNELIGETN